MNANCNLINIGQRDGKYIHRCQSCQKEYLSKYADPSMFKVTCQIPRPTTEHGVGDKLASLLKSLRFTAKENCGCRELQLELNTLGVDGCRREFDRLVAVLQEKYATTTWIDRMKATGLAIITGLAFRLSIDNPIPDLLREAIRQSEENLP